MENCNEKEKGTKSSEWKAFLGLTVLLAPVLSVAFVGIYGFSIWFLQMFVMGPPGQ